MPLLATPPTVTTTLPVVAPAGTGATMLVALQLVGVAAVPLNFNVLVPWVAPKFAPLIVTEVPTDPDVGFRPVMLAGEGFPPPPGLELPAPQPTAVMANAKTSIHRANCLVVSLKRLLSLHQDTMSGLEIYTVAVPQRKAGALFRRTKRRKSLQGHWISIRGRWGRICFSNWFRRLFLESL